MDTDYQFLPELFLRAPYYSFAGYDLERLPEVLATTVFRNAIYLASPDFYRVLEAKAFDFNRLGQKEKHTLYKYYNRMCFRPTPFGSFASFTMIEWGAGETIRLADDDQALLHLLPDESLLTAISNAAMLPSSSDLLISNPTLYGFGKEYRYIKTTADAKGHYQFSIDALAGGKFHRALFSQLRNGPVATGTLLALIQKHTGCSAPEAADYLTFLLAEQLVFPPSRRHMIGSSASRHMPLTGTGPLQEGKQGEEPIFYAALERKHETGGPGETDKEALAVAVATLQKLALPFISPNMEQFAVAFKARFDLEKVPLLIALDPDAGIVYGSEGISALGADLDELRFPAVPAKTEAVEWTHAHRYLLRLWGSAQQKSPCASLQISPDEVSDIAGNLLPPSTLALMFRKTEDHLLVDYAGGTAAAVSLIGRFTAFSDRVAGFCRKLAELEVLAHPDIIFADIGQLSDIHTDNINRREPVYAYEIPVNVYSRRPVEMQLPPGDLVISISGGHLILESVKLKKRVVPRLATAYNHRRSSLAIFRFLADLQYQGLQANLTFSLERYFPGLDFYPRVQVGEVIISPATWHFDEAQLDKLLTEDMTDPLVKLRRFRAANHLPQRLNVGHTDQQLVFDLGGREDGLFFLQCLRGLKKVKLTEYLLPGRTVKTGHAPLSSQYVAFLSHPEKIYAGTSPAGSPIRVGKTRSFLPGGDWHYIKIYCTPESADTLLTEVIWPVVKANRHVFVYWFFIRYFDNGHHLRLRFRMTAKSTGNLQAELNSALRRTGSDVLVRDYQADTYRRELERYGAGIIDEVEAFFCAGSNLVALFTELKAGGKLPGLTDFLLGILTTYRLAADFIGDLGQMLVFFRSVIARFLGTMAEDKQLKTDLNKKYRSRRKEISDIVENGLTVKTLGHAFNELMQAVSVVRAKQTGPGQTLLADLVHMQLNRTLANRHREQEIIIYYFLEKYTLTKLARQAISVSPVEPQDE